MSSIASEQQASVSEPIRVRLSPAIRALLDSVRRRIRQHAVTSGVMRLICFAGIIFWITSAVDFGWFALQKLELPVGLRAIGLALMLPSLLWLIGNRILYPLVRRIRDMDLALLLERRFPRFQDRLMTSVESATGYQNDGPLVRGMLQRNSSEAEALVNVVDAAEVFDLSSLKRHSLLAAALLMSVCAWNVFRPGALERWYSAFIRCDDVYHLRTTQLDVSVIAQPGDRRKAFGESAEGWLYRHPRGMDLELEIVVPERPVEDGPPWVVPERVRIDVVRKGGDRSRAYVSPSGAGVFRFVISRLQEPVELEFLAGDFRAMQSYRVEPVNVPTIDSIRLHCTYPEYTGWNQLRERRVDVLGSEVSLPQGTSFDLTATAAKPLQSVRILTDWFEVTGDRETSHILPREGFVVESTTMGGLLTADGLRIHGQFQVLAETQSPEFGRNSQLDNQAAGAVDVSQDDGNSVPEPVSLSGFGGVGLPIVSNSVMRFFLHDDDDVSSVNPETLRIRGVRDAPPTIAARGVGIDNAITRLAQIPVAGSISDDYGLVSASFRFVVDDETSWRPRPLRRPPEVGAVDFDLSRDSGTAYEIFDVRPLELSEGQTLTLAVTAADGNVYPGPGVASSEPMVFRIVSNEELLSLLYTREIGLRRRFEEVISQLTQVRDDLRFHLAAAERVDGGDASRIRSEDMTALTTCATRSGNTLRRQTNELNAIADGFEEITRQLLNNAVPPRQLAENMRADILNPIRTVAGQPMAEADRTISSFRVAAMDRKPLGTLVTDSADRVAEVVSRLTVILDSVRDMAEFHEALRDLKAILEEQQKLLEETRALQKRNLIDRLKLLD